MHNESLEPSSCLVFYLENYILKERINFFSFLLVRASVLDQCCKSLKGKCGIQVTIAQWFFLFFQMGTGAPLKPGIQMKVNIFSDFLIKILTPPSPVNQKKQTHWNIDLRKAL